MRSTRQQELWLGLGSAVQHRAAMHFHQGKTSSGLVPGKGGLKGHVFNLYYWTRMGPCWRTHQGQQDPMWST